MGLGGCWVMEDVGSVSSPEVGQVLQTSTKKSLKKKKVENYWSWKIAKCGSILSKKEVWE